MLSQTVQWRPRKVLIQDERPLLRRWIRIELEQAGRAEEGLIFDVLEHDSIWSGGSIDLSDL